jgi:hypothetical protein
MNPWMFLCAGWFCFMPMASFGGCVGGNSTNIEEDFEPGTMFLIDENGDHQSYKPGEYERITYE